MDPKFWWAYGFFTGGVIGVGVFALPATLQAAGLLPFLLQLIIVSLVVWWIHRWYLAVIVQTEQRHRLPGYARAHLGRLGYVLSAITNLLGFTGALVAYLLAGGTFLRLLVQFFVPLPPWAAIGLYMLPGALLLLWGLRALPSLELIILALFLVVLGALPVIAADHFSLTDIPLVGGVGTAFLPYGVLLFSLWGLSLIPEATELVGRNEQRALRVLSVGLWTAVAAYLLFAVLVAGITGKATTEDALTGLRAVLGDGVVILTLVFGILTTFSSYLALGLTFLRTLMLDFKLPRLTAWVATVAVPLAFVVLGARSLLFVLGITGAVFLGIEGLIVLAMRWVLLTRVQPAGPPAGRAGSKSATAATRVGLVAVGGLLVLGVVGELVRHLVS